MLHAVNPHLLKHVNDFSVTGLAIVLYTLKQLEWQRNDTIELFANQLCLYHQHWQGLEVSLACSALGHFYIYHKRFWSLAARFLATRQTASAA